MGEYVSVVRKVVARTCLLKNLKIMKAGNNVFMNFQYSRLFCNQTTVVLQLQSCIFLLITSNDKL